MNSLLYSAPLAGIIGLAFAGYLVLYILKLDAGSERMKAIASAIQEGAMAYLNRQYRTVAVIAVILAILLALAISVEIAIGFILGAVLSAAAGYLGMSISVRSNVRCANAAKEGLQKALSVAFRGGAVTGISVASLALLGVSGLFIAFGGDVEAVEKIIGFGFGASLISLFARVGGGIYTKAADVGTDLVGKVEAGIPEDDPRNPGVIADNVGDNVGDCAGMAADLFETYVVTVLGAMLIGVTVLSVFPNAVAYPLVLGAAAIFASIIGIFFVKLGKSGNIMGAMYKGAIVAGGISAILFYIITQVMMDGNIGLFISALVGLGVTAAMIMITDYYTSLSHSPVKEIANASVTGPGTNIITGLSVGLRSTALPVLVISAGVLISYYVMGGATDPILGLYGIAIAAAAMLSVTGIIISIDSYGPITDNAGGIAEMAEMPKEVRDITDPLDAVGNTTKAVTKGYAIGSAALGALALYAAYSSEVNRLLAEQELPPLLLVLSDPLVLIGLFIGGMIPFLFASFLMGAVGRAASTIVSEIRRQFKEIPGIMEGKAKPDYGRCVDIVTIAAQKEMVVPGLLAVLSPVFVGYIFGPIALGGLLIGVIISGLLLALMMTTGGAAWDNAKKYIESGNLGGKRLPDGRPNPTHAAAVVGDTVGDPTKDTAGPAINPLIKVMNIVAILIAALIL
ncbi:vacuolar-type H(+)-translocating pyrophosphatase [Candidatus Methanoperedens nitroreducens]|uniref:K(+)-insensitive pyrophosphate-energized proton pump n=1 Tax=Candidatus Methanoperedens nitratireducens TaxID=1392998 RepID=A0A062V7Y9_9EURY|nr:sodium-translocating pyrophosphatase [Candidatus Methanoperedens nitroreducens]KCZ73402.1 vacuolar-type H(+)-translocating pyrophosphatase [Candidatus Methanoperedens nitroreducens]MDJ1422643.1 sodium-translocating pyrophosphatase [Candidatus Methanoperedens sp.]